MSDFIQDGTGSGYRAKVDAKNRITANAISTTGGTDAALTGDLYNINTETVTLTSSDESAVLYMKNTDSIQWVLNRVFYNLGVSSGGSGDILIDVIANPTTGSIITGGTAITPKNLNFGSSKTLTGVTLKGSEGATITDGEVYVSSIVATAGQRILISFDSIILEPGSSIAVTIKPQAGNTAMDLQAGFNVYRNTN